MYPDLGWDPQPIRNEFGRPLLNSQEQELRAGCPVIARRIGLTMQRRGRSFPVLQSWCVHPNGGNG